MNKRGEILIENVIFMVLNLVFLTILIVFLLKQGAGSVLLEESYAKQIALIIDSATPGMFVKIDMTKALNAAKESKIDFGGIIQINNSYVFVKLSPDSGKEYHYFNKINVNSYAPKDDSGEYLGQYVLTFSR